MGRLLDENDLETALTPAESLDLACVADLGTWAKLTAFMPDPATLGENEKLFTSHVRMTGPTLTPLALFLSALYELLSWRNDDMRGMAHDFRITSGEPQASGTSRIWDANSVLSDEALLKMRGLPYTDVNQLNSPLQGMHVWTTTRNP